MTGGCGSREVVELLFVSIEVENRAVSFSLI